MHDILRSQAVELHLVLHLLHLLQILLLLQLFHNHALNLNLVTSNLGHYSLAMGLLLDDFHLFELERIDKPCFTT